MAEFDDEDFVLGQPEINKPVSVGEIVRRLTALQDKASEAAEKYGRNQTRDNELTFEQAKFELTMYAMKKYVPK